MKNIFWFTTILASFALLLSFQTKVDLSFLDMSNDNFSVVAEKQAQLITELDNNGNYDLPECVEIETEEVKESKESYNKASAPSPSKVLPYFHTNCLPDNFLKLNINQNNTCLSQGLYLLFHSLVFYE